jgi:hypothetical protein
MEKRGFFDTFVNTYRTIRRHVREDSNLYSHCRENLKPCYTGFSIIFNIRFFEIIFFRPSESNSGITHDTIKKKSGTLIDASKEVGLEVNTEKTKYMLLSRHQNAGQNHDIPRADLSFSEIFH